MIRCGRLPFGAVALAFFLAAVSTAQAGDWPSAPWPGFAQQRAVGAVFEGEQWRSGGYHSVLRDTFVHFEDRARCLTLEREIVAYHNEHGLEQRGDLSVPFIPGEERLLLVHLRRLRPGSAEFVDLDYRVSLEHAGKQDGMYIDEQTVAFIPDGVAPGDVVDFAYLVERRGSSELGPWDLLERDDYPASVASRRIAVSAPRSMGLRQIARGFAPAEEVTVDDETRFTWQAEHLEAPSLEPRLPRGYEPHRALLITEADGFDDIARPYAHLLESLPIAPEVQALARSAVRGASDPVAALASLVQRQIRYVGLELSAHKLVPALPSETLRRGWGDCKDMSLLLVQLLRSVGVEAYPALARTVELGPVDPDLPSLAVFNHEIVAVRRAGQWLFVDPTIKEASPPWTGAVWPGERLLVVGGEHGLVEAPPQPDGLDSVLVEARAEVGPAGTAGQRLTVELTTTYLGPAASAMRRRLEDEGESAVRSEALEFFAEAAPGMVLMQLEADYGAAKTRAASLVIRERLVFEGEPGPRCALRYRPPEMERWLEMPAVAGRTMPLGLDHPRAVSVRLLVVGSGALPLPVELSRDDGFIEFSRRSERQGDGLLVTWTARTHGDAVPREKLAPLALGHSLLRRDMGLELCATAEGSIPPPSAAGPSLWLLLGIGVSLAAAGGGLGFIWGRRRREAA